MACTKYESQERVGIILKLICRGVTVNKIVEWVLNNHPEWNLGEYQIKRLWVKAQKERRTKVTLDRDYHLNNSLNRLQDLYDRALEDNQDRFAAEIEDRIQNLLSLKEAFGQDVLGVNNQVQGIIDFRFEEVNEAELKGKSAKEEDKKET